MQQRQKEKKPGRFRKKAMRLLESGKWSAKRMLLSKKKREKLDSALFYAARNGENAEIGRLLRAGAKITARKHGGGTLLIEAAKRKRQVDAVRLLIEKGMNVNARDNLGMTALMWAVMDGHIDSVRLLIENGADVNAADKNMGMTALIIAANDGKAEICALLIEKVKADIDKKARNGKTALMVAKENGEIVAFDCIAEAMLKRIVSEPKTFMREFRECLS